MLATIFPKVEARLKDAGITNVGEALKQADKRANGAMPINVSPGRLRNVDGTVKVPELAELIRFFTENPQATA